MKQWNKKSALRMILYAVLYAVGTAIVCVTGAIHPALFVCYQITAGFLLCYSALCIAPISIFSVRINEVPTSNNLTHSCQNN